MKKVVSYILLIFWLFIIYYFSNQPGDLSGDISSGIIYKTIEFIYNLFSIDTSNLKEFVLVIHNPLRELMHLLEYLILSLLIVNLLKQYKAKKIIIIPVMLCFIYATTDEIHQLFVPGRTFQYLDIFMDMMGAVIGAILGNKIFKEKKN